jgi:2-isopropylmalate synthase
MKNIDPVKKYLKPPISKLADRSWPDKELEKPPLWCSVDLRDGNQSLVNPMGFNEKMLFFDLLTEIGFKEIEIGFPAASETEYRFTRGLLESDRLANGIYPQVLVQSRASIIDRTFEALDGFPRAIVHFYNSTSISQRKIVFNKDKKGIIQIAVEAAHQIKEWIAKLSSDIRVQYSPESFTGTELEFALEICLAVADVLKPTVDRPLILNLPATVELTKPHIYADHIEWFIRNLPERERFVVSLHPHNDRGTGVAATELALLAGADRLEGTLFGNGERTGNVDLVTVALNMYLDGISPGLDLSDLPKIARIYTETTGMKIHERHPYVGELVFTAFSGSHQDAIKKGMDLRRTCQSTVWDVPYIPIDPEDIGRTYEAVVRINSQSGKGGMAYVLEQDWGIRLPKAMHPDFAKDVQVVCDRLGTEVSSETIYDVFKNKYLNRDEPYLLVDFSLANLENNNVSIKALVSKNGTDYTISGQGNGPVSAFVNALRIDLNVGDIEICSFVQESLSYVDSSSALSIVELAQNKKDNSSPDQHIKRVFGVGIDSNIVSSSLIAVLRALNALV